MLVKAHVKSVKVAVCVTKEGVKIKIMSRDVTSSVYIVVYKLLFLHVFESMGMIRINGNDCHGFDSITMTLLC